MAPDRELAVLLDALDAMPRADRRAIVARLPIADRMRLDRAAAAPGAEDVAVSDFLGARIAMAQADDPGAPMTARVRASLRRAAPAMDRPRDPIAKPPPGQPLLTRMAAGLRMLLA